MKRTLPWLIALLACGLIGCGNSERASGGLPKTFFGIAPQDATSDADLARMAAGNVGSYHMLLSWARVEARPGTYDWTSYDILLGQLAVHGLEPIPYAFGTPAHFADEPSEPPTQSEEALKAWESFLTAAAQRYGPNGEFWDAFAQTNPDVEPRPLRIWEIWNEENSPTFWAPQPDPGEYAMLFKRSERALHKVDPEAQIMTGGMFATPNSKLAITSFDFLRRLYAKRNVVEAVDLVAVHPYGPRIGDVKEQMAKTYEQMLEAGNGSAGTWVTEVGWGSDTNIESQLTKTPERQASLLRKTYELMIRERSTWNLQGVLWYTWRDPANAAGLCGWCASAGLVDDDLDAKPAWVEYTRLTGGRP